MLDVALANIPFSNARLPSIALAQLRSVVDRELGDRARARVFHVNHDFAQDFDLERYDLVATSLEATTSGLGDWFFRHVAFPEIEDHGERYSRCYSRHFGAKGEAITALLQEKRGEVEGFLDELIERYDLASHSVVGFTSMFMQNMACFAMPSGSSGTTRRSSR